MLRQTSSWLISIQINEFVLVMFFPEGSFLNKEWKTMHIKELHWNLHLVLWAQANSRYLFTNYYIHDGNHNFGYFFLLFELLG